MKKIHKVAAFAVVALSLASCNDFLDQQPDTIFNNDQIFSDEQMIKSVVA